MMSVRPSNRLKIKISEFAKLIRPYSSGNMDNSPAVILSNFDRGMGHPQPPIKTYYPPHPNFFCIFKFFIYIFFCLETVILVSLK